uniref:Uncharacterized protein n=1 Tax=Candidatus Methanomethylicus mesodigestus TaxID=1867258 RepID=A0A7C3F1U0_9CREN
MPALKLKGDFETTVMGTVKWQVDFYHKGPPPIAIAELKKTKSDPFRELLKLIDIKASYDARCIMISAKERVDEDLLSLATKYGIYVALEGDQQSLAKALSGGDVPEVNSAARESIIQINCRKLSKECRSGIEALLQNNALTYKEILSELKYKYDKKIIYNQLRYLLTKNKIILLGRTSLGEGIYGYPRKAYPIRIDMSKASKANYLSEKVLSLLDAASAPISTEDMAVRLQCSRHMVRAIIRNLSKENQVLKKGGGWVVLKYPPNRK